MKTVVKTVCDSESACIRCNWCAPVCPVALSPLRLFALAQDAKWRAAEKENIASCLHCRRCDDICPAALPLSAVFARAKSEIKKEERARAEAQRLKARYDAHLLRLHTPPSLAKTNPAALAAAAQKSLHNL